MDEIKQENIEEEKVIETSNQEEKIAQENYQEVEATLIIDEESMKQIREQGNQNEENKQILEKAKNTENIEENKDENDKIKVKNIIFIVLISIVLFIYLVILVNSFMNKRNKNRLFPYTTCVAIENIENPKIDKGDLIIIKAIDVSEIQAGDIVVFEKSGSMVIKPVLQVKDDKGTKKLIVDSDEVVSKQSFTSEIKGKSVRTIKGLGNIAIFVKTPLGTLVILTMLICVIALIRKISNHKGDIR